MQRDCRAKHVCLFYWANSEWMGCTYVSLSRIHRHPWSSRSLPFPSTYHESQLLHCMMVVLGLFLFIFQPKAGRSTTQPDLVCCSSYSIFPLLLGLWLAENATVKIKLSFIIIIIIIQSLQKRSKDDGGRKRCLGITPMTSIIHWFIQPSVLNASHI